MRPLQHTTISAEGKNVMLELPVSGTSQCVGFARKWLEINLGLTFTDVNKAIDIWRGVTLYKRLSDDKVFYTVNRNNGHARQPQFGDLIIYNQKLCDNGHVAVVTDVDKNLNMVSVVEQNFMHRYQSPDEQRQIPYLKSRDGFQLLQQHIVGWKHIGINET